MLQKKDKYSAHYTLQCDKCHKTSEELATATTFEVAREMARARQWFESARKGRGIEKWEWWCPACNPTLTPPSMCSGLTTGIMLGPPEGELSYAAASEACRSQNRGRGH